jgi:CRP-like cAMP-binding protein
MVGSTVVRFPELHSGNDRWGSPVSSKPPAFFRGRSDETMRTSRGSTAAAPLLPDGSPLKNRLLGALPPELYAQVVKDLRMTKVVLGAGLIEHGATVKHVYFPNGGVYSVTNQMRDGEQVEVATVGTEGMLGVGVFLGDLLGTGRSMQQVPNGMLPTMTVAHFQRYTATAGPFRDAVARYAQANLLQVMQCTACNALHTIEQRCCRWLLQTHDRVDNDEFQLKHEFLAIMLGTTRPSVTVVIGSLQRAGLITSKYGRIRILDRKRLEETSCECYDAIRTQFIRLRI